MELLKIENLSFSYPLCNLKTLDDISFTVERGDFVAVCGATGSGKSTLLRLIKREIAPLGELHGGIYFKGKTLFDIDTRESAGKIGYVMQRPEQQIVTDKVWHELAFGLENLGVSSSEIRRRVAEMACYFGIEDWFDKNVSELSGGQKQLLNLAAVMVMQPDILLLDEPTSQLDPIAASNFISTVAKLNRELSLTIIMIEHRLEELIPASTKLLALESGRICAFAETRKAVELLRHKPDMLEGMPAAVRIYSRFRSPLPCPLDVREGRNFIENSFSSSIKELPMEDKKSFSNKALEFSDVFFRYTREQPDVLSGLSFTVFEGELFFILGGNGSGKSTALAAASALIKPYSGVIKVFGKKLSDYKGNALYDKRLSMLPQDVQTIFMHSTVRDELTGIDCTELPFDLSALYDMHPYDLSGGQMQLVALAKALSAHPRLLLLDEPTKGLDAHTKKQFVSILKQLCSKGITVVCVTHDVEFAAVCADRCAMFFRGEITACDKPRRFFAENNFYSTASGRMTRGYYNNVLTVDDAEKLCLLNSRRSEL